jgi:uncharacterized membrane protein YbaN (DUF454 family)
MIADKIKRAFFFVLGFICLGMAYIGFIMPGIPFSIFLVSAAYCFARSSQRMHDWLMNHKYFGPFLQNWGQKRIFPQRGKYLMIAVMTTTVLFTAWKTASVLAIVGTAAVMIVVAIWAWRFPGSVEEHQRRLDNNEKIGWLK